MRAADREGERERERGRRALGSYRKRENERKKESKSTWQMKGDYKLSVVFFLQRWISLPQGTYIGSKRTFSTSACICFVQR